jgi:hypothetical protein
MSDEETNELIEVMNVENGGPGFVRSTDTGAYDKFGVAQRVVSQGRTSENAWCRENCDSNPKVENFIVNGCGWVFAFKCLRISHSFLMLSCLTAIMIHLFRFILLDADSRCDQSHRRRCVYSISKHGAVSDSQIQVENNKVVEKI